MDKSLFGPFRVNKAHLVRTNTQHYEHPATNLGKIGCQMAQFCSDRRSTPCQKSTAQHCVFFSFSAKTIQSLERAWNKANRPSQISFILESSPGTQAGFIRNASNLPGYVIVIRGVLARVMRAHLEKRIKMHQLKRKMSHGKRFLLLGGALLAVALLFTLSPFNSSKAHAAVSIACPPTQSPGANNDWVKVIQYRLNGLMLNQLFAYSGGYLSPDGGFGNNTYNAVVAFQSQSGLQANGQVGPLTWSMLGLCNAGSAHVPSGYNYPGTNCPPSEYQGYSNTFVNAAQHMINMAAYYGWISTTSPRSGWYPLSQDGNFGSNTLNGVYDFQAGNPPISVDGNIGSQTWNAMGMCF